MYIAHRMINVRQDVHKEMLISRTYAWMIQKEISAFLLRKKLPPALVILIKWAHALFIFMNYYMNWVSLVVYSIDISSFLDISKLNKCLFVHIVDIDFVNQGLINWLISRIYYLMQFFIYLNENETVSNSVNIQREIFIWL